MSAWSKGLRRLGRRRESGERGGRGRGIRRRGGRVASVGRRACCCIGIVRSVGEGRAGVRGARRVLAGRDALLLRRLLRWSSAPTHRSLPRVAAQQHIQAVSHAAVAWREEEETKKGCKDVTPGCSDEEVNRVESMMHSAVLTRLRVCVVDVSCMCSCVWL